MKILSCAIAAALLMASGVAAATQMSDKVAVKADCKQKGQERVEGFAYDPAYLAPVQLRKPTLRQQMMASSGHVDTGTSDSGMGYCCGPGGPGGLVVCKWQYCGRTQ